MIKRELDRGTKEEGFTDFESSTDQIIILEQMDLLHSEQPASRPRDIVRKTGSQHYLPAKSHDSQISISPTGLMVDKRIALYKTEMCRTYEETGICRYGIKCQFAHDQGELRGVPRHPRYKTEICKTFWQLGNCPYGKRCCFIHTENELYKNSTLSESKYTICIYFAFNIFVRSLESVTEIPLTAISPKVASRILPLISRTNSDDGWTVSSIPRSELDPISKSRSLTIVPFDPFESSFEFIHDSTNYIVTSSSESDGQTGDWNQEEIGHLPSDMLRLMDE